MATTQELIDKRASAWAQAQDFLARSEKGEELSAEDNTGWDAALKDVDTLGAEIDKRTKTKGLDDKFAEIDDTNSRNTAPVGQEGASGSSTEKRAEAFDAWLRKGTEGLSAEHRSIMEQATIEHRAQSSGTDATGGYTVPEGFWDKVTETMKYYGSVLSQVEVINTSTGNDLPWPTNNDTGNVGAILAENTQISETGITFGQKQLGAYTYTSKLVLASLQFMQDSAIDAEGFIARKLGERLGRIHNTHFTVGTGSGQPQGFITGATTGKTAAGVAAITWEELVDLIHSVDVAYRAGGASFQMHDLVLAYVRKLKDSEGRPLWQPSLTAGAPDTLLGHALSINNDMASVLEASAKTVAFGNFRAAYVARFARGMTMMQLRERYADYLQVGFHAFDRADGLVQDASAAKILVQAAS